MATELIIALATLGGIIIGVVGKYFSASSSSTTKDTINLRNSTLKRIEGLEKRQSELEKNVQVWTLRYWGLYRWMVRFCVRNNLEIIPPTFHEMDDDTIEDAIADMYKKNNPNEKA